MNTLDKTIYTLFSHANTPKKVDQLEKVLEKIGRSNQNRFVKKTCNAYTPDSLKVTNNMPLDK